MGWAISSRWPCLSSGVAPADFSHAVIILILFYINSQQRTQDLARTTFDLDSWQAAHFTGHWVIKPSRWGHTTIFTIHPLLRLLAELDCKGTEHPELDLVEPIRQVAAVGQRFLLYCNPHKFFSVFVLGISTDKIWWTWKFLSLICSRRDASSAFTLAHFSPQIPWAQEMKLAVVMCH